MASDHFEKAAQKFVKGKSDYLNCVTSDRHFLVDQNGGATCLVSGVEHDMPLGEFVGGVAFTLANQGKIYEGDATPVSVSRLCFEIGKLVGERS